MSRFRVLVKHLQAKKESSDKDCSTSESEDEEYAMAERQAMTSLSASMCRVVIGGARKVAMESMEKVVVESRHLLHFRDVFQEDEKCGEVDSTFDH
ncbi:hypothetical protein Tco_0830056 [Tanacetum coccineum]